MTFPLPERRQICCYPQSLRSEHAGVWQGTLVLPADDPGDDVFELARLVVVEWPGKSGGWLLGASFARDAGHERACFEPGEIDLPRPAAHFQTSAEWPDDVAPRWYPNETLFVTTRGPIEAVAVLTRRYRRAR